MLSPFASCNRTNRSHEGCREKRDAGDVVGLGLCLNGYKFRSIRADFAGRIGFPCPIFRSLNGEGRLAFASSNFDSEEIAHRWPAAWMRDLPRQLRREEIRSGRAHAYQRDVPGRQAGKAEIEHAA